MNPLDQFRNLEATINVKFLEFILALQTTVNDPANAEEVHHFRLLKHAYEQWYHRIHKQENTKEVALHVFRVMDVHYDVIVKRSSQLFYPKHHTTSPDESSETGSTRDFFLELLEIDEDPTGAPLPEDFSWFLWDGISEATAINCWEALLGLYRLSLLIDVVGSDSIVKDLIELVLMNHKDINSGNVIEKMTSEFKTDKKFRRMLLRLLKSDFSNFEAIFEKLLRVISTLSESSDAPESVKELSGLSDFSNVQKMIQQSSSKAEQALHTRFSKLLTDHQVVLPADDTLKTQLFHWLTHEHTARQKAASDEDDDDDDTKQKLWEEDVKAMQEVKTQLLTQYSETELDHMLSLYGKSELVYMGSLSKVSKSMNEMLSLDPEQMDQNEMMKKFKAMMGFSDLSNDEIESQLKSEFEAEEKEE